MTEYKREDFICIPRQRVVTPDGLKPRRSIVDLRDELMLGNIAEMLVPDSSAKNELPTDKDKFHRISSRAGVLEKVEETALIPVEQDTEQAQEPSSWKVVMPKAFPRKEMPWKQQPYRSGAAFLPPIPTRSWSTEGGWSPPIPAGSSPNGSSPPSTRRGSWGTTPSAESPNLVPGQARTAVGNLVALQQDPPGTTPVKDTSYDWAYSPQERGVETMYSPMYSRASSRNASRTYPLPRIAEQSVIAGMSQVKSSRARCNEQECEVIEPMYSPLRFNNMASIKANSNAGVSTLAAPSPLVRSSTVTNSAAVVATTAAPDHQGTEVILSQQRSNAGYSWTVTSSSDGSNASKASKLSIKAATNSVILLDDDVLVHVLDDGPGSAVDKVRFLLNQRNVSQ